MNQPPPQQDSQKKTHSPIGTVVVVLSGICFFIFMFIFLGPAMMIVAAVFAFAAIHYLIWGKWLSKATVRQPEQPAQTERNDETTNE